MRANVYDTDGERVLWLKIMLIEVDKKEPITYLSKYNYEESSFKKLKMKEKKIKIEALHERHDKKNIKKYLVLNLKRTLSKNSAAKD